MRASKVSSGDSAMRPPLPPIRLAFDSVDTMRAEFQRNLRAGGAFCPGVSGFTERTACMLVLVHPVSKDVLELKAEVVSSNPKTLARAWACTSRTSAQPSRRSSRRSCRLASRPRPLHTTVPAIRNPNRNLNRRHRTIQPRITAHKLAVSALHDRLRGMSLAAQIKLAREGGMTERVASNVSWASLCGRRSCKPAGDTAEVSRIARMGTASVGIIDTISSNAAWLQSSEVRRALLSIRDCLKMG